MPQGVLNGGHSVYYIENHHLGYHVDHVAQSEGTAEGKEKEEESANNNDDNNPGKLPIICVHGLGSSANFYVPIFPYLDGHQVVALTSYGASQSKSQGEKLSVEVLAEDVIGVMDYVGISRAILVGHSMGGPIAFTAAARYPERVAGVVALGPVNPASVKPEIFEARIETVMRDGMEPLANTIPQTATGSNSTPLQRAFIRELIMGQEARGYASLCDAIIHMKDPGFASITTPVLILAGEEDKSAPLDGCQYIHDHLGSKRKELKVLKGVGHWHCIEAGEEVGKEISAFAAKLA